MLVFFKVYVNKAGAGPTMHQTPDRLRDELQLKSSCLRKALEKHFRNYVYFTRGR